MKYEDVINAVGGCGRYQIFMLNLLYIATIFDGLHIGSTVFIVPTIKHRCAIPGLPNDTYEVQSEAHAKLIEEYIPQKIVDGKQENSECHLYVNTSKAGNETTYCSSWVYDKSIFETSISMQFNLVCQREWLARLISTIFFGGYFVTMLICGWFADRFGRKPVIIGSLVLQGVSGILCSQIGNYYAILSLRFINAVGGGGSFLPSIVLGSEMTSVKRRMFAAIVFQIYFAFGFFIVTLLAYYIRTWKLLVLLVSLPSIPMALIYLWILPESPRWLLIRDKKKEAGILLSKIAVVNKRNVHVNVEDIEISGSKEKTYKLWKIFTIPKLLKITLILMFNWCTVSFVYYGLILNSENLSGDIYLNFFFGALVEIPAYVICLILLNRIGRKKLYIGFMAVSALTGILTIFPVMYASDDLQWTTTMLAIISKLAITGTFGIIYLHSCELYPTCVRNGALGVHSTFARVGGILAPYIMLVRNLAPGKFGRSLPLLTMGLVCFLASISYVFLPETNNKPMEDTFDVFEKDVKPTSKNDEIELEEVEAILKPSA